MISNIGTISNLEYIGFGEEDMIHELIDNSVDAGAKNIDVFFFPDGKVAFKDDGCGMSKETMTKMATINELKDSTDSKSGRFGVGFKAACRIMNKAKTHVISKTANSPAVSYGVIALNIKFGDQYTAPIETLNPERVQESVAPIVWELITATNSNSILTSNGTLIFIPEIETKSMRSIDDLMNASPNTVEDSYQTDDNKVIKNLICSLPQKTGYRYHTHIYNGLSIRYHYKGTTIKVVPLDLWKNVEKYSCVPIKHEVVVYENKDTNEIRFKVIGNELIRGRSPSKFSKEYFPILDKFIVHEKPEGFIRKGEFYITTWAFSFEVRNLLLSKEIVGSDDLGMIHYVRNGTAIYSHPGHNPDAGTYKDRHRPIIKVEFSNTLDREFGVEIHKSRLTKIHACIASICLTIQYYIRYYENMKEHLAIADDASAGPSEKKPSQDKTLSSSKKEETTPPSAKKAVVRVKKEEIAPPSEKPIPSSKKEENTPPSAKKAVVRTKKEETARASEKTPTRRMKDDSRYSPDDIRKKFQHVPKALYVNTLESVLADVLNLMKTTGANVSIDSIISSYSVPSM